MDGNAKSLRSSILVAANRIFQLLLLLVICTHAYGDDLFQQHQRLMRDAIVENNVEKVRRLLTTPYVVPDDPAHSNKMTLMLFAFARALNTQDYKIVDLLASSGGSYDKTIDGGVSSIGMVAASHSTLALKNGMPRIASQLGPSALRSFLNAPTNGRAPIEECVSLPIVPFQSWAVPCYRALAANGARTTPRLLFMVVLFGGLDDLKEVVEVFGAKVDWRFPNGGETALTQLLDAVVDFPIPNDATPQRVEKIEYLIRYKGGDVNLRNSCGVSAIDLINSVPAPVFASKCRPRQSWSPQLQALKDLAIRAGATQRPLEPEFRCHGC